MNNWMKNKDLSNIKFLSIRDYISQSVYLPDYPSGWKSLENSIDLVNLFNTGEKHKCFMIDFNITNNDNDQSNETQLSVENNNNECSIQSDKSLTEDKYKWITKEKTLRLFYTFKKYRSLCYKDLSFKK